MISKAPFESIVCDYFYFVVADRVKDRTEQQRIKFGTNASGPKGLCKALRRIFVTFCVQVEISSDGVSEFSAKLTKDFLKQRDIHHRMLSADHPMLNGRAKLAVRPLSDC